jgi:RimJ/RimL family protein N-acetyltransferase
VPDVLLTATGRLRLRPPSVDDLEAVFAIQSDPETNRYPPTSPPSDHDEARVLLDGWMSCWADDGIGYYVVEQVLDREVVGFTGVRLADGAEFGQSAEPLLNLYYRFTPAVWGRGYAREVAAAALQEAEAVRPERAVVIVTRPDNAPALKLAAALGFGFYRDVEHEGPAVEWRRRLPSRES